MKAPMLVSLDVDTEGRRRFFVERLPDDVVFDPSFFPDIEGQPWVEVTENPDDGRRVVFRFENGIAEYALDWSAPYWAGRLLSWEASP